MSKLTEYKILAIRAAAAYGASQKELADSYGVRQSSISKIILQKTWKNLA